LRWESFGGGDTGSRVTSGGVARFGIAWVGMGGSIQTPVN